MEFINTIPVHPPAPRRIAPLTIVLGAIFVFFCAVLIFVFVETTRAHPVMLDQQGKPINSQPHAASEKIR
jgi:hypothetical protein